MSQEAVNSTQCLLQLEASQPMMCPRCQDEARTSYIKTMYKTVAVLEVKQQRAFLLNQSESCIIMHVRTNRAVQFSHVKVSALLLSTF